MPASPAPPPPPAERAKPMARNLWGDVFLNAISVTFDSHKIALAALIGVVWLIGIALVGVAMFRSAQHGTELLSVLRGMIGGIVFAVVWTSACTGIAIGGIARLVEIELSQARRREIAEGLQFILRNLATLPFILLVLALGILLSQAIVNLLVGFLATNSGAVRGGILAIPLFLVNLSALIFLALEVPLVPCIMAVEDCGALAAFLHLNRLFAERGGRLVACQLLALAITWPLILLALGVVVTALVPTLRVCGGPVVMDLLNQMIADQGPSVNTGLGLYLLALSTCVILGACAAVFLVYMTGIQTIIYRLLRR
jgi:hypothetical protein